MDVRVADQDSMPSTSTIPSTSTSTTAPRPIIIIERRREPANDDYDGIGRRSSRILEQRRSETDRRIASHPNAWSRGRMVPRVIEAPRARVEKVYRQRSPRRAPSPEFIYKHVRRDEFLPRLRERDLDESLATRPTDPREFYNRRRLSRRESDRDIYADRRRREREEDDNLRSENEPRARVRRFDPRDPPSRRAGASLRDRIRMSEALESSTQSSEPPRHHSRRRLEDDRPHRHHKRPEPRRRSSDNGPRVRFAAGTKAGSAAIRDQEAVQDWSQGAHDREEFDHRKRDVRHRVREGGRAFEIDGHDSLEDGDSKESVDMETVQDEQSGSCRSPSLDPYTRALVLSESDAPVLSREQHDQVSGINTIRDTGTTNTASVPIPRIQSPATTTTTTSDLFPRNKFSVTTASNLNSIDESSAVQRLSVRLQRTRITPIPSNATELSSDQSSSRASRRTDPARDNDHRSSSDDVTMANDYNINDNANDEYAADDHPIPSHTLPQHRPFHNPPAVSVAAVVTDSRGERSEGTWEAESSVVTAFQGFEEESDGKGKGKGRVANDDDDDDDDVGIWDEIPVAKGADHADDGERW